MPDIIFTPSRALTRTPSRAALELGLKPEEFALAVDLGRVRIVSGGSGSRRVEQAEIDRLRALDGFPGTLRDRLRVVGTAEGAELLGVPPGRFTRLARLGLLLPVHFYPNRHRAVVWLYLAEELREFAAAPENTRLLGGRTPEILRGQLTVGVDLRARNWRGRQLGILLRRAEDPWARAGAVAALLAPSDVADIVEGAGERARLNRFRPAFPGRGTPGTANAHLVEQLVTAQDPDEIRWLRSELTRAMDEARTHVPGPCPAGHHAEPAASSSARHEATPACTHTPYAERVARPAPTRAPRRRENVPGGMRTPRGPRARLRRRSPGPVEVRTSVTGL
ncbi:DUF6397 family protein [Streptomyces sp. TG1A-8]|uniref:DUF6397 family protein n=1 Tax=Streptomyces sp. TG1A-8 TaxID=3051385 RepID=UPI00265BD0E8|nr:DUF6397 family protein [Streptomyces sp. TG1A-8]MDO0928926.1 DUF6397 family protein [Streptomyces sp. TG1A-8]